MGDKTGIQWTNIRLPDGRVFRGATWNPTTGCTKVSAGCDHCYAETQAARLRAMGQPKYRNGFALTVHPDTLDQPLRWQQPRGIFVNSMSDLFHVGVPNDFLAEVFVVMANADRHIFQVLTKRPQRARNFLTHPDLGEWLSAAALRLSERYPRRTWFVPREGLWPWPIPNVWLGTSVEDARVRHRIEPLLETPAAVRFLSCEPLLGPLVLDDYLFPRFAADDPRYYQPGGRGVDWVITGGESGEHARPCDPDWVREIRDECRLWGVAFFHKQWGGRTPKSGGRELDGRTWDEFPMVPTLAAQAGRAG